MCCGPRRCLLALVALLCAGFSVLGAEWKVVFPGGESSAFPVEDGRHFVAVAPPGQNAAGGRLMSGGRQVAADCFPDSVSRIVVFRTNGPASPPLPMRESIPPGAGFPVRVRGGEGGTTAGWVKQVGGKVLPLALVKIEYRDKVPPPGQPLLDDTGKLVAVSHQASGGRGGYALPVEAVRRVLDSVRRDGRMVKARLGLSLQPESKEARVHRVLDGSPASRAGVKPSDLLLEVGGRGISDYADAVNAFYFLRPAVSVPVKVRRGGEVLELRVTPGAS